ncbi:IS66 family insertion sequence element accessory protein TnpA [Desulfobacula phenolica]
MKCRTGPKKPNGSIPNFWKHHIEEWSKSGLSQNAYCR